MVISPKGRKRSKLMSNLTVFGASVDGSDLGKCTRMGFKSWKYACFPPGNVVHLRLCPNMSDLEL